MDETTVAKALQTDLNSHKVRIQVKRVERQLYILASRDEQHSINYEFLFSLIQTRLEQLKINAVESFTLYGRVIGSNEPEWQKVGAVLQMDRHLLPKHHRQNVDTLIVVNGKVQQIKSEQDLSHIYPQSTKLAHELKPSRTQSKAVILFLIMVTGAIAGGFWAGRWQQEQLINQAQILSAKPFDLNKPASLDILSSDRQNVSDTIARLEAIPNLPFSEHQAAQAQIPALKTRLAKIDQQFGIEQKAVNSLNSALKIAEDAMAIAKNPPHKPQVWRQAQAKWGQSLQVLKTIPIATFARIQAQEKIKAYTANYASVSFQLKKQLTTDAIANLLRTDIGVGIQVEMRDLKSSGVSKIDFMNVCTPFVSFNLDPAQVKNQQVELSTVAVEMCNYLWTRK